MGERIDDVRIRSEGGVERVEELTARFRRATAKCATGYPEEIPAPTVDDEAAMAAVARLDANHESLRALAEARAALAASLEAWATRFGFTPTRDQLPIRYAGEIGASVPATALPRLAFAALVAAPAAAATQSWQVGPPLFLGLTLVGYLVQRERMVKRRVLITANELIVGEARIPHHALRTVSTGPARRISLEHANGRLTLEPGDDFDVVFGRLNSLWLQQQRATR